MGQLIRPPCPRCKGYGSVEIPGDWKECPVCHGTGLQELQELKDDKES
jgi:DnaJ-class molecular chaperone